MKRLKDVVTGPCYVMKVITGSEKEAKSAIGALLKENQIDKNIMLAIPLLEKLGFRDRKPVVFHGLFLPGYIFIFGEISNEKYSSIRSDNKVAQFLPDPESELLEVPQDKWRLIGVMCNEEGLVELLVVEFDINDRIVIKSESIKMNC